MRVPCLRDSWDSRHANPYSNQELHIWSLLSVRTPVLWEGRCSGTSQSWVWKTVSTPRVHQTKRKNRTMSIKTQYKLWIFIICTFLIYITECLFVCLFVPYTNSHFWTNLNQTLHTSPPWSGRDRRVCMVQKCLTFSTFLTFSVGSECRILGTKWLLARVICDSVISVILAAVSVTSRKWRCSRRQFCILTGSVVHYR